MQLSQTPVFGATFENNLPDGKLGTKRRKALDALFVKHLSSDTPTVLMADAYTPGIRLVADVVDGKYPQLRVYQQGEKVPAGSVPLSHPLDGPGFRQFYLDPLIRIIAPLLTEDHKAGLKIGLKDVLNECGVDQQELKQRLAPLDPKQA